MDMVVVSLSWTPMAAKTRYLAMRYFCSSWFGFATNHVKSNFRVFSTTLKHFNVHKLIGFRDSHNYDNSLNSVVEKIKPLEFSNKTLFSVQIFFWYILIQQQCPVVRRLDNLIQHINPYQVVKFARPIKIKNAPILSAGYGSIRWIKLSLFEQPGPEF